MSLIRLGSLCSLLSPLSNALLAGLKHLNLERTSGVSDAALPIVAQQLRQLTKLELHHTGVTEVGVAWLRKLDLDWLGLYGCKLDLGQLQGWPAAHLHWEPPNY